MKVGKITVVAGGTASGKTRYVKELLKKEKRKHLIVADKDEYGEFENVVDFLSIINGVSLPPAEELYEKIMEFWNAPEIVVLDLWSEPCIELAFMLACRTSAEVILVCQC